MKIGQMTKRIALQSFTTTRDEVGQPIKTYATYDTVWAGLNSTRLGSEENEASNQVYSEVNYIFTIRYHSSIKAIDRIVFGARIFDINVIRDLNERNCTMELDCTEMME